MPTISYPDNDGVKFDFTSIELDIAGTKFVGVTTVSYSDELEPGPVRASYAHELGATRGEYSAEASMTVLKEEMPNLLALLSDAEKKGFGEKFFTATVQYSETGKPVQTDTLEGVRIKKLDNDHQTGPDALVVKIDLRVGLIVHDGYIMVSKVKR